MMRRSPVRARFALTPVLAAVLTPLVLGAPAQEQESSTAPPARSDRDGITMVGAEHVELPEGGVRIPFELSSVRPVPVVKASINGKGPFAFFLDTGASVCVLDSSLVRELELPIAGTTEIGDPSDNARLQADQVVLEELVIGGITYGSLPAVAFDRSSFGGSESIRGVLGLPLFLEHVFTLDYVGQEVHVHDVALSKDDPHVVEMQLDPLPKVYLEVAGTILTTTIDSGSPAGFSLPLAVTEGLAFREPLTVVGRARTVNSTFDLHAGRLDGKVRLAGHDYEDPPVDANDILPHVNIGYGVLRSYALTFDLERRLLRFDRKSDAPLEGLKPRARAASGPAREGSQKREQDQKGGRRSLGVELAAGSGSSVRVVRVVAGSEAERSGLLAGDEIVSVNGARLSGRGEALGAALVGKDPVRVGVRRGDETLEIVLFES